MSQQPNYPQPFIERMQIALGHQFPAFIQALGQQPPVSVRINPFKPTTQFDTRKKIPWCSNGYYLAQRPSFTFDPLFHAGTYYVQEASSMFLEEIWKQLPLQNHTLRVLDMCAAPGGKSTHLLSLIHQDSLLVSNEIIPNRNKVLRENITKWGTANTIVTQNKPEDFAALPDFFDVILTDAPCSGEGMFRKDENAITEWSEKNVALCAARQNDILQQAIACLKPGGFLIYSTCTFAPQENDEQIESCIQKFGLSGVSLKPVHPEVAATKHGFHFYPHRIQGEGFYIAVLQKQGEAYSNPAPVANTQKTNTVLAEFLKQPEKFVAHTKNDLLFAIPQTLYSYFQFLEKHLYIRHAGIYMGTPKGKDFLPSHDLALSIHLKNNLPVYELTLEQAIAYLRSESLRLNTAQRGWCLATYQQQNLGWMKLLEGRMNNYYPKDMRILKRDF